jgi:Bifunctional DNA primase/polymerase, N-terminal
MSDTRNPRLEAALRYAAHGWPVLALVPNKKIPATRHGVLDATTSERQIIRWFDTHPDRNVGIATGAPGPDVLDVDNHGETANGFAALNRLKRAGLVPEPSAIITTPHLYFKGTQQGNGSMPKHHIDARSLGGYVVAPPSMVNGRPYVVVKHQAVSNEFGWQAARNHLEPPERRVQPQRMREGTAEELDRLAAFVARQESGNRNNGLHWAASRAAEHGLLDADGVELLVEAALRSGLRGGEREARKTIQSALGRGLDPHVRQLDREMAG